MDKEINLSDSILKTYVTIRNEDVKNEGFSASYLYLRTAACFQNVLVDTIKLLLGVQMQIMTCYCRT